MSEDWPVKGPNMKLVEGAHPRHGGRGGVRWDYRMTFRDQVRALGHASYDDYLLGPHWKDVRRRFFASKLFSGGCYACDGRTELHLHHRTYKRFGYEWLEDLVVLCGDCHRELHQIEREHGTKLENVTRRFIVKKWKEKRNPRPPQGHPHFRLRKKERRCYS